jgi:hypothetical protein
VARREDWLVSMQVSDRSSRFRPNPATWRLTARDKIAEGGSMAGAVQPVKDRPEKAVAGHSVVSVA